MPRKLSHGPIIYMALASLLVFNSAEAAPVTYEWSTTTGFLSSTNRDAIETITGQIAVPNSSETRWFVLGNMNGTFTYDKDNGTPVQQTPTSTIYFGANLDSMASLFSATDLVGTLTTDVGAVIVTDDGVGGNQDVVNVSMCCGPLTTDFAVGTWRATGSSVVWVGEGFQDDQSLPLSLPPVGGTKLSLGLFFFFNPNTNENVAISSAFLDFREAVQTVEQLQLTPVVQGSAIDQGPQDGVFDGFLAPPNDGLLDNNGFVQFRFAFEFDMGVVPIGAEILSAELQVCISNFEGSRDVELHGYDANGTLELDDYARNGLIENKIIQPTAPKIFIFDVTNNIARITGNAIGFAGYNLRSIFTAGGPIFAPMFVEEQCFPNSGFFPRLVINISDVSPIAIDIKPGDDPNDVNPRSAGVIPVAVLGSVDFDATLVDFSTVTFGPGAASPAHDGHVEDVNGDGFVDMVFHFNTQETGIQCGDIEATLTGETFGGQPITVSDAINTVGCPVPAGVTYDFTQTFGNIQVSGTLTYNGIIPASISVDDLNTLATWDLSFSTIVPDPDFPLEPFSLSDSDSSWGTELIPGTSVQIDATATELVFDLMTPLATNAAVVLMSDGPDFKQFRFGQGNQPGFVGAFIVIQGIDIASESSPLPFDEPLSFPIVSP